MTKKEEKKEIVEKVEKPVETKSTDETEEEKKEVKKTKNIKKSKRPEEELDEVLGISGKENRVDIGEVPDFMKSDDPFGSDVPEFIKKSGNNKKGENKDEVPDYLKY